MVQATLGTGFLGTALPPYLCTTCSPTQIMLTMAPKWPACPNPDPPPQESPGPVSSAFSIPLEDLVGPHPMLL